MPISLECLQFSGRLNFASLLSTAALSDSKVQGFGVLFPNRQPALNLCAERVLQKTTGSFTRGGQACLSAPQGGWGYNTAPHPHPQLCLLQVTSLVVPQFLADEVLAPQLLFQHVGLHLSGQLFSTFSSVRFSRTGCAYSVFAGDLPSHL